MITCKLLGRALSALFVVGSVSSMANAEITIDTGNYSGNGVLIVGETQAVPYKVTVKITKANNDYTWAQTFNYANGETLSNVFTATLDATTGFLKIFNVNGQAQNSAGYCAKDEFTGNKTQCTYHWQQNGQLLEDTVITHKNGSIAQFGSDPGLDQVWHDLSKKQ